MPPRCAHKLTFVAARFLTAAQDHEARAVEDRKYARRLVRGALRHVRGGQGTAEDCTGSEEVFISVSSIVLRPTTELERKWEETLNIQPKLHTVGTWETLAE